MTFAAHLDSLRPPRAAIEAIQTAAAARWRERNAEHLEAAERARREMQSTQARRERLIDKFLDDAVPEADYRQRLSALDREIQDLEARAEREHSNPEDDLPALLKDVEKTLGNAGLAWRSLPHHQRLGFQIWAFPAGIRVEPSGAIQTPETCLLLSDLRGVWREFSQVVPPTGFEPVSSP